MESVRKSNVKNKDLDEQDLEGKTQLQLGDFVKNSGSIHELMSHNALFEANLLDLIMRDNDARAFFLLKLDLITANDETYMDFWKNRVILQVDRIDYLLRVGVDISAVTALIKYMAESDPTGLLYQPVIHSKIEYLMKY